MFWLIFMSVIVPPVFGLEAPIHPFAGRRVNDDISLPPLPVCNMSPDDESFFRRLWEEQQVADNNGHVSGGVCSQPLLVLMPSNSTLTALFPKESNPFESDSLLRHLTLFSHVFVKGWDEALLHQGNESTIVAMNGAQAIIKKQKLDDGTFAISANGHRLNQCQQKQQGESDPCVKLFILDGILEVTKMDVDFAVEHPSKLRDTDEEDDIVFRHFELPLLSAEMEDVLRKEVGANLFADMWKKVLTDVGTVTLNIDEMLVLAPSDGALKHMIPELLKPNVPNPIVMDLALQQHILSSHIIVLGGSIPTKLLENLPQFMEVFKLNLRGDRIVIHREDTKGGGSVFKANGETLTAGHPVGHSSTVYGTERALFPREKLVKEAIQRAADSVKEENPFPSPPAFRTPSQHLLTAFVPPLENTASFALRSVGAGRFASIWLDVKAESQQSLADEHNNTCLLPKDVGPCKEIIGQFYFDYEKGKCAPFVYGGCGGNGNRFPNLISCSEACASDPREKESIRQRTCQLPVYQYEVIKPEFKATSGRTCTNEMSKKFHFNKGTAVCEEIDYLGCFGTDNVFETLDSCRQICQSKPELAPSEVQQQPQLCSLPPSVDTPEQRSCNDKIPKWSFSDKEGRCEAVFFNSCGATENLFDTEELCRQKCKSNAKAVLHIIAPSDQTLEALFAQVGHGQEVFTKNAALGRQFILSSLTYHACSDGKDVLPTLNPDVTINCEDLIQNAFDGGSFRIHLTNKTSVTADEIRAASTELPTPQLRASSPIGIDSPRTDSVPSQPVAVRSVLFNVGLKNFSQLWDGLEVLNLNREMLCSLPKNEGDSAFNSTRFYYDSQTGFCRKIFFSGLGGNENNFETYDECTNFCGLFQGRVAVANILERGNGRSIGNITLIQAGPEYPVLLQGHLSGLSPGPHGFHVHQIGNLGEGCKASGTHFNPKESTHGAPEDLMRHVGDLGNIVIKDGPVTEFHLMDSIMSLYGEHGVIGRTFVVHQGQDDLGKGEDEESKKTGNAGGRLACGLIEEEEPKKEATVTLTNGLKGKLSLVQHGPLAPVKIRGKVEGLERGLHGFHVHQSGDIGTDCIPAGPHFNPRMMTHGAPMSDERHVGDLGNIATVDAEETPVSKEDFHASLYDGSMNSIIGRSVVIHAKEDDLGLGGHNTSLTTGNAGGRVGCGIIEERLPLLETVVRLHGHGVDGLLEPMQRGYRGRVQITGHVKGLPPGKHGFHVHAVGATGNGCLDAGPHFNPLMSTHGSPDSSMRHVGDLGNVEAAADGVAAISIEDEIASLKGEHGIVGKTVVVHANEDDLGKGMNDSLKTGNAGARIACGIIQDKEEAAVERRAHATYGEKGNWLVELSFKQFGPGDFVEVESRLSGAEKGSYNFTLKRGGGGACEQITNASTTFAIREVNTAESAEPVTSFTDSLTLFGNSSAIGANVQVLGPDGKTVCAPIEQSRNDVPEICSKDESLVCDNAHEVSNRWKYDADVRKCFFVKPCLASGLGTFATESQCRAACPNSDEDYLVFVPTNGAGLSDKETLLSHLVRGSQYNSGSDGVFSSLSHTSIAIKHVGNGNVLINGVPGEVIVVAGGVAVFGLPQGPLAMMRDEPKRTR